MSIIVKQAVILAGGMGERLKPFTDKHPKPMYPFGGIPFIEYLIKQVKSFGMEEILLLLGYRAQEIIDYLGDGNKYGIKISYKVTPVEYETGNRLVDAVDNLDDSFLLMYCDNYCPIDYKKLETDYVNNNANVQLSIYSNEDDYTKNNVRIKESGIITVYDKSRKVEGLRGVDIGYAIVCKKVVSSLIGRTGLFNFEAVVYPDAVEEGKLFGTISRHRYYSVGSWDRISLTERFFESTKTVFLDRDGTINVRPPRACYIERPEDFRWIPGAQTAIKKLKESGFQLILVSNQPGIARGNLNEETLFKIHEKMQNELVEATGYKIDAIYYCPHNWDEGCDCRKPKPGMLYQAQKDLCLDLTKCILIGDDDRDIDAGKSARCRCYKVSEEISLLEIADEIIKNSGG